MNDETKTGGHEVQEQNKSTYTFNAGSVKIYSSAEQTSLVPFEHIGLVIIEGDVIKLGTTCGALTFRVENPNVFLAEMDMALFRRAER